MKKMLMAALFVFSSVAFAGEVTVLETEVPRLHSRDRSTVDSRFYIDTESRKGYVKVKVSKEIWNHHRHFPHRGRHDRHFPSYVTVFEDTVKVDNLVLEGDQVMYYGAEGAVNCGTMGVSRVFKIPTLYLSGNCKLSGNIMRDGVEKKLIVTMKTK
ncbi:MAG: hypothetical protein ACLGHN_05955 [Bacteriovoracia bacterium]